MTDKPVTDIADVVADLAASTRNANRGNMSHRYDCVCVLLVQLDQALRDYVAEETAHHVPRDVAIECALRGTPVTLVRALLDGLPTLAGPWRVTDMRDGEPTRLVRDGHRDEPIAVVRRQSQGKRARPRWIAFVGDAMVSPEPAHDENGDAMPIDWADSEFAQAACDTRLVEDGVMLCDDSG